MTWAVEQKLPALQKLVLLMLANRTNHETGVCIPRIKTLAEECGMSIRSCQAAIRALVDLGMLRINPRFNDGVQLSNQYQLMLTRVQEVHPPMQDVRESGAGGAGGRVQEVHTEPGSIKPGKEPKDAARRVSSSNRQKDDNQEAAKTLTAIELVAMHGIEEDLAQAFLAHRKAKKAKLTLIAMAGICREATSAGWALNDALRKIIERNWIGFEAAWVEKRGEAAQVAQTEPEGDWWQSTQEIERVAAEKGVKRKPGEEFYWFKCRVAKACKERRWMDLIIADLAKTKNSHYAAVYQYFNGNPPMENAA